MNMLHKITGAGNRRRGSRGHKGGDVLKNLGLKMGGNPYYGDDQVQSMEQNPTSGGNEKKEGFGIKYGGQGTSPFDPTTRKVGGYSRDGVNGGNPHAKTGGRKSRRSGRKSRRSRRRSRSSRK